MVSEAQLCRDYLPLAKKMARKWARGSRTRFDDLYSAGLEGLAKAARSWNPSTCANFAVHATRNISWTMIAHVEESHVVVSARTRRHAREKGRPIVAPVKQVNEEVLQMPSGDESAEDALLRLHEVRHALGCLDGFPARTREIVLRRCEGLSFAEIGELVGLTRSRVQDLSKLAFERLRKEMSRG